MVTTLAMRPPRRHRLNTTGAIPAARILAALGRVDPTPRRHARRPALRLGCFAQGVIALVAVAAIVAVLSVLAVLA